MAELNLHFEMARTPKPGGYALRASDNRSKATTDPGRTTGNNNAVISWQSISSNNDRNTSIGFKEEMSFVEQIGRTER
jgi:hypothetical protein